MFVFLSHIFTTTAGKWEKIILIETCVASEENPRTNGNDKVHSLQGEEAERQSNTSLISPAHNLHAHKTFLYSIIKYFTGEQTTEQ